MRRSTRLAAASATAAAPTAPRRGTPKRVYTVKKETRSVSTAVISSGTAAPTVHIGRRRIKKIKVEQADSIAAVKSETPDPILELQSMSRIDGGKVWRDLCSTHELSCVVTLTSGQVFTWQREADTPNWIGVVGKHVFKLREHEERVQFQCVYPPHCSDSAARGILHDYFRLEVEVVPLYKQWTVKDDDMSRIIRSLPGLRIVRQDPVECLFAFICSSNNNIQRIMQMVSKLKASYGELLYEDEDQTLKLHAFPSVDVLATHADDATLRSLGFGYRAPFVIKTALLLRELGGLEYLMSLRTVPESGDDDEYAQKLMAFAGVGRKVADCIGLFALDKLHAIPVDTHVWQIACREFDPSLKSKKSLTPSVYRAVGDHFRARFSPLAGWAHSVLFTGDLSSFQERLPDDMQKKRKRKGSASSKAKVVDPTS